MFSPLQRKLNLDHKRKPLRGFQPASNQLKLIQKANSNEPSGEVKQLIVEKRAFARFTANLHLNASKLQQEVASRKGGQMLSLLATDLCLLSASLTRKVLACAE